MALTANLLKVSFVSLLLVAGAAPAAASERWVNPIAPGSRPDVSSYFDPPEQDWLAGHRGVDLNAGQGSAVSAAGAGTVTFSGLVAGRGVITISHGDLSTTYEPVNSAVAVGSDVGTGEFIGTISSGGHCSARCLHWGLKRGDTYLDPLSLLTATPIILKPVDTQHATTRSNRANVEGTGSANQRNEGGPSPATAAIAVGSIAVAGAGVGVAKRLRRGS